VQPLEEEGARPGAIDVGNLRGHELEPPALVKPAYGPGSGSANATVAVVQNR